MPDGDRIPYVTASFSGGKDSTAMVLRMLERGEQLDEVIWCDTGMEFPAMYEHIAKVRQAIEREGVKFTRLAADESFEDYLLRHEVGSDVKGHTHGYGWPSARVRWCTGHLKTIEVDRRVRTLREAGYDVTVCVGLAADELKRLQKRNNQGNRHPLVEWGWTEDVALGYCYGKGYDWHDPGTGRGLYELFDRTSCWICPLQSLGNLRTLRRWYPDLWAKIGEYEKKLQAQRAAEGKCGADGKVFREYYQPGRSWQSLEDRFSREDRASAAGQSQRTIDSWDARP